MVAEFFRALVQAGIPIAVTSFLLVWWALKNGYLSSVSNIKDLKNEVKRLSKSKSSKKKHSRDDEILEEVHGMNPVHNKWLAFGGGFYGVVGLLTYVVVELGEIRDFLANFDGIFSLISDITPELFIGLFVDSIKNFIVAIAWPAYWLSDIRSDYIWIWFAVAYLSYSGGSRYAIYKSRQIES